MVLLLINHLPYKLVVVVGLRYQAEEIIQLLLEAAEHCSDGGMELLDN